MHNFGRGMWRRVGDYDRVQAPQVQKNFELQYYLALLEQSKRQRLEQVFNTNKRQMKQQTNNVILEMVGDKDEHNIDFTEAVSEVVIEEQPIVSEVVIEEPIVSEVVIEQPIVSEVVIEEPIVSEVVIEEASKFVPKKSKKKNKK